MNIRISATVEVDEIFKHIYINKKNLFAVQVYRNNKTIRRDRVINWWRNAGDVIMNTTKQVFSTFKKFKNKYWPLFALK